MNYVITAKIECLECPFKSFTKKEGKTIKFPWICIHEKQEGANPAIETKDNTETFAYVEGKKLRHCDMVYVAPVKEKKERVKKEKKEVVTETAPVEAPVVTESVPSEEVKTEPTV